MEREPMPSFPEQALSEHGSFVRRLARRLLADAHLADDVAQEAWSRYFAAPPASTNPRGWFARTLRNLATNTLRARARRAEHEQRGARPEPLRSGADEAEQAEVLRTLVEAVLALEPTQRDTLLALYFRGVDAKTLARESGVPEPTVRDRQRRALATLRQRLDGRFGDKRAWGAALARLAGPTSPAPLPLGLDTLAAAVGVVALGSLGVAAWARAASEGEASAQTVSSSESLTETEDSTLETMEPAPSAAPREATTPCETPPSARSEGQEDHAVESIPQVVLRGRFVTSAGHPLAGVPYSLGVGGAIQGTGRPIDPPEPVGLDGLGGASEADGRFELSFPPVDTHSVLLLTKAVGYSRVAWEVDQKPAGEYDFGDVTLYRGATLTARIVDASGQPMTGLSWRLSATVTGVLADNAAYQLRASAQSDPVSAEVRLEGLLPGLNRISLRSDTSDQAPFELFVSEGESISRDFVYSGADPRRRLAVSASVRPHVAVPMDLAHFHVIGQDGVRHTGPVHLDGLSALFFEGLEPGMYALEIDDPRFEFVRLEGQATGTIAQPRLCGNSGFLVSVLDPQGNPVEVDSIEVELRDVNFLPNAFRARAGKELLAGGMLRGCIQGDYVLRVNHEGSKATAFVDALAAGEIRPVVLQLGLETRIAGRLLDERGAPQAGVEILALRPAEESDSEASPIHRKGFMSSPIERFRKELASAVTDDQGNFTLALEEAGRVLLRAKNALCTVVLGETLELTPGEERSGLSFSLPETATLSGVVHAPPSESVAGMKLWFLPMASGEVSMEMLAVELEADGLFAFRGLPAVRGRVFLTPPETEWTKRWGSGSSLRSSARGVSAGRLFGAMQLAEVELAGDDLALDLRPSASEWSSRLELEIRVDGRPAPDWGVTLRGDGDDTYSELIFGTDLEGRGGLAVMAGRYFVEVEDPLTGWKHAFPDPIVVQPSQVTRQVLEVERP